jgi:hypothetical protein
VPIFIPQIYPHSYYNSRYGMEMLPALALCLAFALYRVAGIMKVKRPSWVQFLQPVALLLCVLNLFFMLHATPLVLKEGMVNSQSRRALETPLAEELALNPPGAPILIDNSEFVGALQMAGIPLKQTIGPSDYYRWKAAMAKPGKAAAMIVSADGDEMSKAIKAHPEGLGEPLTILCTTGQPCLRVYQSSVYGAK